MIQVTKKGAQVYIIKYLFPAQHRDRLAGISILVMSIFLILFDMRQFRYYLVYDLDDR